MHLPALKSGILLAALTTAAFAQTTLHTGTTLVLVPTLVQTPAQSPVFSLTASDFALTDNGVAQKVTLEEETTRPLSLVVLIQTGGTAPSQFPNYAGLELMLASILGPPPNQVSIVNFDSLPEGASPFTSDIAQWAYAIDHPDPGDRGAAIFDSISYALTLLDKQPPTNRRVILLISQQHDDGSKTPLKEVVRDLGETNTSIYSISFSAEKAALKQAFKGPPHLNPPIATSSCGTTQGYINLSAPLALILGSMRKNLSAEVATLSGGEAIDSDTRSDLDEALDRISSHLHNSYFLSFSPSSAAPGLHTLQVHLPTHPELIVSARSTYWSSTDASSSAKP
jgi:VWFA-related protein